MHFLSSWYVSRHTLVEWLQKWSILSWWWACAYTFAIQLWHDLHWVMNRPLCYSSKIHFTHTFNWFFWPFMNVALPYKHYGIGLLSSLLYKMHSVCTKSLIVDMLSPLSRSALSLNTFLVQQGCIFKKLNPLIEAGSSCSWQGENPWHIFTGLTQQSYCAGSIVIVWNTSA